MLEKKLDQRIGEFTKICDVNVNPVINEVKVSKDKVRYVGELNLRFVLTNEDISNATTFDASTSFDFSKEIEGIDTNSKIESEIVPVFREFIQDNMDVSVKVDLKVNINSYNLETVNVIDNIEETEDVPINPYSMVIYFVKKGDTLWKIAKKYQSTIGDIVRINEIENPDNINVGMKLFIPKFSSVRTQTSFLE